MSWILTPKHSGAIEHIPGIVVGPGDPCGTYSFAASVAPVALLSVPLLQVLAGDGQRSRRCNRRNEVRQRAFLEGGAATLGVSGGNARTSAKPRAPRSSQEGGPVRLGQVPSFTLAVWSKF